MAVYGNYAFRLPASLMDDLCKAAESDGVPTNGFIVQAVAEKVAARAPAFWPTSRPKGRNAIFTE